MTFKEKLMKEYPTCVNEKQFGGCFGCPGYYWDGAPEKPTCKQSVSQILCTECWNREIPGTEKPESEAFPYDLHKLIDECMEKKDRYITIFTSKLGTSVSIYPLDEEDEDDA